jgi:predicted peptidase
MAYPDRFAAIVPMSGAADPKDACRIGHLPAWVFHGELDDQVPIRDDRRMVDAVRACGGTPKFTVYPQGGHAIWTEAYETPELLAWMLAQRRGK